MERKNKEFRCANEILPTASALFVQAKFDRKLKFVNTCIDQHRDAYGVESIWEANLQVYGVGKVWKQMNREDTVACCTVERLMRRQGLQGARWGKTVRTTVLDCSAPRPRAWVNRQFKADRPNQFWVSDFTYVPNW